MSLRKTVGLLTLISLAHHTAQMVVSPFIYFPTNGEMGYLVALAVPLDLQAFTAFWSFNYEANWNEIGTNGYGIKDLHGLPALFQLNNQMIGVQSRSQKQEEGRQSLQDLMSRTRFYESLSERIHKILGLPGKECLLRVICEHALTPLGKHNGVVGEIAHIVLSPSASKEEPGMEEYLEAETVGRQEGHCGAYSKKCGLNVLDMVSTLMHFGEK